jgi:LPS O-antigen subunit length determinant protein (WzzB/FepE family)
MGHGIIFGFAIVGMCSATLYAFLLKRENKRRAAYIQIEEYRSKVYTLHEIQAIGDQ